MLKSEKKSRNKKGTRGNKRLKVWQEEMDNAIRAAKFDMYEDMIDYLVEKRIKEVGE